MTHRLNDNDCKKQGKPQVGLNFFDCKLGLLCSSSPCCIAPTLIAAMISMINVLMQDPADPASPAIGSTKLSVERVSLQLYTPEIVCLTDQTDVHQHGCMLWSLPSDALALQHDQCLRWRISQPSLHCHILTPASMTDRSICKVVSLYTGCGAQRAG